MEENRKNNYRITFHDGPLSDRSKSVDVVAKDPDEAFEIAYSMPEARRRLYDNILIEKIPIGPSVIGVKFEYYDTAFEKNFTDQVFIKAENEQQAINYYNKYYKGGRFNVYGNKTVKDGRCIRGRVLKTYFTGLPGFDADATVHEKKKPLDDIISSAKSQHIIKEQSCDRNNYKSNETERY